MVCRDLPCRPGRHTSARRSRKTGFSPKRRLSSQSPGIFKSDIQRLRRLETPVSGPTGVQRTLQVLPVVSPWNAVDHGRVLSPASREAQPKKLDGDMMEESCEPCIGTLLSSRTHTWESDRRCAPALCPDAAVSSVFPVVGPLSSDASADCMGPSLFGGFSGSIGPSDFPSARTSHVRPATFPGRPSEPSAGGVGGMSRFPCKEFPCIHRVSDSAGFEHDSRVLSSPMWPSASVNRFGAPEGWISELKGRSACTHINASPAASRRPAHDSGP